MRYFYSSTCANVSEATHQRWRDRILRREGQRRWNLLSQRIMVAIEGVVELGKLIRWTSVSPQSIWKAVSKAVHAVHLGPGEHCERLDGPARLPLIGLSATRSESTRYHLRVSPAGTVRPNFPQRWSTPPGQKAETIFEACGRYRHLRFAYIYLEILQDARAHRTRQQSSNRCSAREVRQNTQRVV